MAFNVKDYVKDSQKSPVERVIDPAVANATNGQPNGTRGIAESTAKLTFDTAGSYENITALSSIKTDNIVSGAADEFYALAGKNTERASRVNLKRLRRISDEDTNSYLNNTNPATKIGAVKKGNSIEIISVL